MSPSIKTKEKISRVKIEDDPVALDLYRNSKITIGTDLEVTLHPYFDRLTAVTGLNFWDTGKDGKVGTDGKTKFFQYLIELRPDYAWDGRALLDNVLTLVKKEIKAKPKLKSFMWKAGTGDFNHKPVDAQTTYYLPKGGHIHFGSVQFEESFIYAFDMLLAPLTLVLEDPVRATMRRARKFDFNGGTYYGQLGGWRASQHAPTWEYRTLPNFCLNFTLSEAIFNIAKAILFECMENKAFVKSLKSKVNNLRPDVLTFNFCQKEYYRDRIDKIFIILSKLRMLDNKYGKDILSRLRRYIYNHNTWNLDCDMLVDFSICDPVDLFKFRLEAASGGGIPANVIAHLNKHNTAIKKATHDKFAVLADTDLLISVKELVKEISKCTIEVVQKANGKVRSQPISDKIEKLISSFFSHGGEAEVELDRLCKKLKASAQGKGMDIDNTRYNIERYVYSVDSSHLIF